MGIALHPYSCSQGEAERIERCSSGMRVSAVLYVMKVPIEGETPDLSRVTRPDDVAELHGSLESFMRAHCIHEQGERHGIASAFLHPWPNVNDAQPFVQLFLVCAHPAPPVSWPLDLLLAISFPLTTDPTPLLFHKLETAVVDGRPRARTACSRRSRQLRVAVRPFVGVGNARRRENGAAQLYRSATHRRCSF